MKKMWKRLPQIVALMAMLLVFLPGAKSEAAVPFTYPKHVYAEYYKNNEICIDVTLKKAYRKYHGTQKYTKIKVKNTKIAVKSNNEDLTFMMYEGPYIKLKKTGTTRVTFDVQLGKSKKVYHCSTTLHVVKYKKPIKKVTVGGKNMTSNVWMNPYDCRLLYCDYELKSPSQRVKIQVTPNSGWKITKMVLNPGTPRAKTVKNGSTIKIKEESEWVRVTLKNPKTKVVKNLEISMTYWGDYD